MSAVGALQNYYVDSTNCYNRCGFFNTSKQERLGFDNRSCLINCDNYYSNLKNLNRPSIPVTFERGIIEYIKRPTKPTINSLEQLKQHQLQSNINCCQHQCDLNSRFMSNFNLNECKKKCAQYRVISMKV